VPAQSPKQIGSGGVERVVVVQVQLVHQSQGSEDGSEVSVVQVHPDADSMLFHMQVARQHIESAIENLLDVGGIQIYGPPNDAVLEMTRQLSGSGVPISVKPHHLAGFTRLRAG
jgi:hypothetical protein